MYNILCDINSRPRPFEYYTAAQLWTNEHTSAKMLEYHLNGAIDVSSRKIEFIDRSARWLVNHFRLNPSSRVIDFDCGPGLYTTRFARNGVRATGIDFSQRSIEYARQAAKSEGLEIEYIHMNYLEYDSVPACDLVTMIMCDFCALGPGQRKNLLSIFRNALKDDGRIVLDVYSLNAYRQREETATYERNQMSNFWSPDDHFVFLNTFKYDDEKVVLDKYSIVEKTGMRVVYNWLQYYSLDSLKQEFGENGLLIAETYSDVAGSEYDRDSAEIAIVAKKK